MKKIIFLTFLIILSLTFVKALPLPVDVTADAVILVNLDNDKVVYEKNINRKEVLASLTKMMTTYVAILNADNLDEKVIIKYNDISNLWGYTIAGLNIGDKVTYRDLLYATMLPSGADASMALANHLAGSEEEFVKIMNEMALNMGLTNTQFADCYGGSVGNISTAKELVSFLKIALQNETFKNVFETTTYTLTNGLQVTNYTRATATFYGYDSDLLKGNKAGFTMAAGLSLVSTAIINDISYALIVLKSEVNTNYTMHIFDTYKIYNHVIDSDLSFEEKNIITRGTILETIPVTNGTIDEYTVAFEEDFKAILSNEEIEDLRYEYDVIEKLTPENKLGDSLGYFNVLVNDEIIYTYDILLKDEIFLYQKKPIYTIVLFVMISFIIIVFFSINLFKVQRRKI